jgi:hypothetical protein
MKKINKTIVIGSALLVSSGLIASLAVASSDGDRAHAAKYNLMKAIKLDANNDGMLSQDEILSRNAKRFAKLDKNSDGTITAEEFNIRVVTMFKRMDVNGDGLLSPEEMPKHKHHNKHHNKNKS